MEMSTSSQRKKLSYYSIVPLHVGAIHLATYQLPKRLLGTTTQEDATTIDSLAARPISSLIIINLSILLVQISFSLFLKTCFQNKSKNAPAPPTTSFRLDIASLFLGVVRKVDLNQSWLIIKEWTMINTTIVATMNIIIILIGSPINSIEKIEKNILLSCLISSLAFFPTSVFFGWNQGRQKSNWIRLFSSFQPQNEYEVAMLYPAIGTCLGCWLGAIPIPLDWDRPWQTWPITCVIGCVTGHALGSFASIL